MKVRAAPAARPPVPGGTFSALRFPFDAGAMLVALAPLLYVYMPRPPISGAHLLVFPVSAAILAALILLRLSGRAALGERVVVMLLLLLFLDVETGASFVVNAPELRGRAILELLRPAVIGVFLLYGYCAAGWAGENGVRRGLLLAAYLILAGQLVIAGTQAVGVPAFDLLYSADKSRPFGTLMRVTGSLGNPNAFAWAVAQATAIVFACAQRRKAFWCVVAGMLILVSGSRTLLLFFPAILAIIHVWSKATGWKSYARGVLMGLVALGLLLTIAISFAEYFPYLAELRNIFIYGSLGSVHSFAGRLLNWSTIWEVFTRAGDGAWLFGLGSRDVTQVVDNDFLFVFFRLGILGVLAHVILLVYLAVVFRRHWPAATALVGMEYLIFSVAAGLSSDTLGGWNFPLLLFFFAGLTLGLAKRAGALGPDGSRPARGAWSTGPVLLPPPWRHSRSRRSAP
jgi:hypothetical protein